MPVTNTPYGAQWTCDKPVTRGGRVVKCNANGIASDRQKAQKALDAHVRSEHRR